MTRRRVRDLQRLAVVEASRFGARLATLELTNGGHLRANFVTRVGKCKSIFFPSTPSDVRFWRNDISLARRVLRR